MFGTIHSMYPTEQRQRGQVNDRKLKKILDNLAAEIFNEDLGCSRLIFQLVNRRGKPVDIVYDRSWVDGK
jgi:hypothetical protein